MAVPIPAYGSVVAVVEVTLSLDSETVRILADASRHLAKPESEIVRGASALLAWVQGPSH